MSEFLAYRGSFFLVIDEHTTGYSISLYNDLVYTQRRLRNLSYISLQKQFEARDEMLD